MQECFNSKIDSYQRLVLNTSVREDAEAWTWMQDYGLLASVEFIKLLFVFVAAACPAML